MAERSSSEQKTNSHERDENLSQDDATPRRRSRLEGKRIAILATDGVEQDELTVPRRALIEEGAEVFVVSPLEDEIQMWRHHSPSDSIDVDLNLDGIKSFQFDALVLPGGVMNPDDLRMNRQAVDFVRQFVDRQLPVAAICHGPWLLVEADAVEGVSLTSWPSLKTDLMNAGAIWQDSPVVRDRHFITSRKPSDLPDFNRELILMIAESPRSDLDAPRPHLAPNRQTPDSEPTSERGARPTREHGPSPGAEAAP